MRWLVGETSCLVDMSARGALAAAVERLRADPAERGRLAAATAERATRRFHWEHLRGAYLDLYRRALGHPSPPRRG